MSKQNIEFSSDENSLIIKSSKFAGEYQTKKDGNACVDCAFYHSFGCSIGGMLNAHCSPQTRKDSKSIIWIKKETEMTKAPAPAPTAERFSREAILARLQHRHFDLIVQWAKNPTQPVWAWNGIHGWEKAEYLMWNLKHYAIGEKPTEPPIKMVKYDGGSIEFPEPAKIELERDKEYWAVTIYGADRDYWTGHSCDFILLRNGLIQLTKEGAERQSEALAELLKNHAQKWG